MLPHNLQGLQRRSALQAASAPFAWSGYRDLSNLPKMTSYKELLAQKHALDQHIAEVRKAEATHALAQVRQLIQEFGFTAQQVFPWKPAPIKRERRQGEVRYRNPATGATWTGRGRAPAWIAGQDRRQFAVHP